MCSLVHGGLGGRVLILIEIWYYFIVLRKLKKNGTAKTYFCIPNYATHNVSPITNDTTWRFLHFFSRHTYALTNILRHRNTLPPLEPISFCGRNTANRYNCRRSSDWWTVVRWKYDPPPWWRYLSRWFSFQSFRF